MLALLSKDKVKELPKEISDVERTAVTEDEIQRILRETGHEVQRELPDTRLFIFQRGF